MNTKQRLVLPEAAAEQSLLLPEAAANYRLILPKAAANYLSVTTRTLANWRSRGVPNIKFVKVGRCVRYRLSDLDAFIDKNSQNSQGV